MAVNAAEGWIETDIPARYYHLKRDNARLAITLQGSEVTDPGVTVDVSELGIAAKARQLAHVGMIFPGTHSSLGIAGVDLQLAGIHPRVTAQAAGPALRPGPAKKISLHGNAGDLEHPEIKTSAFSSDHRLIYGE